MFSEVEGVYLMEWRGHVLCSGGMFSEVEGVYLVWWRGYAECRRVYVQKTYEVEGWDCGSAHMECPFHQLKSINNQLFCFIRESPRFKVHSVILWTHPLRPTL